MKKIALLLGFLLLTTIGIDSRPAFIPEGANWRIDIYPGAPNCTMDWYEVSRYYDDKGYALWGQGQCRLPGDECHCYDWVTWWFGIVWVPDPPEGWESIYGTNEYFPTYNPITGKYE